MKKFILLAVLFIAAFTAQAQLPDGSIAPDFTITDLDGNTHHLYEYLGQGKTVILDLSATWCPPCWSYHNSGALKEVYECYGEGGSDNVVVLMVEGDDGTSLDDLYGNGGNTLGDWVTGTPYPVINDDNLASTYQLAYWPTIYRICPGDTTVYELGQAGAQVAKNAVLNNDCTPPVSMDDPALTCSKSGGAACVGTETGLEVNLFNSGANTVTSATIEVVVDGMVQGSFDWTGSLGLYQEETVNVGSFVLTETAEVSFNLTNVTDERMTNNDASASFEAAPNFEFMVGTNDTLTFELVTDNYGNETYWALLDDMGEIVADGGNAGVGFNNIGVGSGAPPADAGAYGNNETISEEIVIPAGCYNLVLTDYWGDGICCTYGNGSFKLSNSEGAVLIEGGQFGAQVDNPFAKSELTSNEEVLVADQFQAFPNPVNDQLTVSFGLLTSTDVTFDIINAVGQVVYQEDKGSLPTGEHIFEFNMNNLASGLYFVNLRTEFGVNTQRVVKQ